MSEREQRARASRAREIANDDIFLDAMEAILIQAGQALETVDPENKTEIMRLQARAYVARQLPIELQAIVVAAPPEEPPA